MIGIGKIDESYRDGVYVPYSEEAFEDDDEVAVIHGPPELAFPALSDAMVDLRESFAAAADVGVIEAVERDALVAAFKRRSYRERSFAAVPEVLNELCFPQDRAAALSSWLPTGRIAQKQADARSAERRGGKEWVST